MILMGFFEAMMRERDWHRGAAERRRLDAEIAALKAETPAEAFAAAWSRGEAMSLQEAVRYALERVTRDA